MAKLLILSAGSFASEVEELARTLGYDDISFLDDDPNNSKCKPVIGSLNDCSNLKNDYPFAIVAFGNNENRAIWHKRIIELGYKVPTLISPLAYVSPEAKIANGCIIRQFCVVGRNAVIGESTILNLGAKVDHDCVVGDFCHLLIGSIVRGSASVPSHSWLQANEVEQ